jgi:DNA repair protein RecO (recombination protein O)
MPVGEALLSGFHLNELLLRLLARDDPHPALFDAYAVAVEILASDHGEVLQAALRAFELLLLREVGLLPPLDVQTTTLAPLDPETRYSLVPETGLRESHPDERGGLTGLQWLTLSDALAQHTPFVATLRACAAVPNELRPQLRQLLHYHCGVSSLRTRQMMVDLQKL